MATLSMTAATDIVNDALDFYIRGDAVSQTTQKKPLVRFLEEGKETFPGGKQYVNGPVQGTYMQDTAGFLVGYANDTSLSFAQAMNVQRWNYPWREIHAGLAITFTELTQDGISISDRGDESEHADVAATRLTPILKNRLADFSESWARAFNNMLWQDGSQDALQVAGVRSILSDTNNTLTVGSLSQVTYTWWRQRINLGLGYSPTAQTLTKFFRNEVIQLQRYGGSPNKMLCGSDFWSALMEEVSEKGIYTQSGFAKKTDIGMRENQIALAGVGTFEYDPTLDSMGLGKRCYVFDSKHIKLRPIEGEDKRTWKPERPYQYMVFFKSLTWKGTLVADMLNCMGVYGIA